LNISLLMLSAAYLVMRLTPPRPQRADRIRQPSMLLLGLMIALTMLAMLVSAFVVLVPWTNIVFGLALALSWFVASCRYRTHAEPGWIEGIDRALGIGWVLTTTASYPLFLLAFR
jgi:hypothetical protein